MHDLVQDHFGAVSEMAVDGEQVCIKTTLPWSSKIGDEQLDQPNSQMCMELWHECAA